MCRVTSGCEGGAGEKKPHQGVQTAVLSAGGHRREASCSDLCREHNLSECVLLRWRKEYEARGEAAFTEKSRSLAKRSPREARRSPSWSVSAGSSPWRIRS
jgi:transposase